MSSLLVKLRSKSLTEEEYQELQEEFDEIIHKKLGETEKECARLRHTLREWKHDPGVRTLSTNCTRCWDSVYYSYELDGTFSLVCDEALTRECR